MKKIIFTLCLAFACLSAFSYDLTVDIPLNGNVKNILRTDYSIVQKFGEYYRTPNTKFTYIYNDAGKLIESSELTAKDAVVNKIKNSYDENGLLTEQVGYDSDEIQAWKSVISYKNGQRADISEYGKDGSLKSKVIFGYSDTRLTEESYYNAEGTLVGKTIYKYDGTRLSEKNEYFADGTLDTQKQIIYTASGKFDVIANYDSTGTLKEKSVFRYNANDVLTEVTVYGAENKVTERKLVKLDSYGNLVKLTTYAVSKKFGTTVNEMAEMTEFAIEY